MVLDSGRAEYTGTAAERPPTFLPKAMAETLGAQRGDIKRKTVGKSRLLVVRYAIQAVLSQQNSIDSHAQ